MKLKEIENSSKLAELDLEKYVSPLLSYCGDICRALTQTHRYLMRGSRHISINDDTPLKTAVYDTKEREKKVQQGLADTPLSITERINSNMRHDFGYPFRYSMFCTSSASVASDYGSVAVIFPYNGFRFCYSEVVDDLFINLSDEIVFDARYINALYRQTQPLTAKQQEEIKKFNHQIDLLYEYSRYKAGSSSDTDLLVRALNSGHEIMIYPANNSTLKYFYTTEKDYVKNIARYFLNHKW